MRFAIVVDRKVVNVVLAAEGNQPVNAIRSDSAAIGDTWNGEEFIKPEPPPAPEPSAIVITKVQAITAMHIRGVLPEFESYMQTAPELTRKLWDASYNLHSDSPMLIDAWHQMGKSEADLLDIFEHASTLKV